ncbi:MAG: glycosyltransferase [Clostridia bacterium]|nr:glycosyltransferase [Clostridia bacterium]
MPKVSVIIPVFNVENYLERCLKSVTCQTFKDIEIIIINDGSTDKSFDICKKFAESDKRIILISQKNSGVSAARNAGINISTGKYLSFVDSDDFIAPDMIEFLINNLEKNNADIATCGMYDCYIQNNNKIKKICNKNKNKFGIIDSRGALQEIFINGKVSLFIYDKLYKRELFDNLRFSENMIYEDAEIMPKIITRANKIFYSFLPKYYYLRHENSLTSSKFREKDLDIIKVSKENLEFIKNNYNFALKQAEFRFFWSHLALIDKMIWSDANFQEFKNILKFVKKNKFSIISNKYFTLKRKMLFVLLLVNINLYKKVIKFFHKRGK